MNPKDQAKKYGVCDLEYAQELKKLGCKQEGIWWWDLRENRVVIREEKWGAEEYISAPTASELGEALPYNYVLMKNNYQGEKDYICYDYENRNNDRLDKFADTLANAMAKMLIYLLEQGLINAKKRT